MAAKRRSNWGKTMPQRIIIANVRHVPEWPPIGYYVGRGVPQLEAVGITAAALANPFRLQRDTPETRAQCLAQYRQWLDGRMLAGDAEVTWELEYLLKQASQRDITLLCWCAPKACHAQIIAQTLQQMQRARNLPVSMIEVARRA
jgi:hypothetical protein